MGVGRLQPRGNQTQCNKWPAISSFCSWGLTLYSQLIHWIMILCSFCYFAAVPLDKLLKDPAQFREFLYKTTKLSPRVVAELFNSTVNVQKVGTKLYINCMLLWRFSPHACCEDLICIQLCGWQQLVSAQPIRFLEFCRLAVLKSSREL